MYYTSTCYCYTVHCTLYTVYTAASIYIYTHLSLPLSQSSLVLPTRSKIM